MKISEIIEKIQAEMALENPDFCKVDNLVEEVGNLVGYLEKYLAHRQDTRADAAVGEESSIQTAMREWETVVLRDVEAILDDKFPVQTL